jgi:hypothetical protein
MKKKVTSNRPLPQLAKYLYSFNRYFIRSEGRETLERYIYQERMDKPLRIMSPEPITRNSNLSSLIFSGNIKELIRNGEIL